ncbi:hypothetical protein OROGR_001315 [Orobanche gracilis]
MGLMHIFLANFQRQLQQSVNAGKKFYKNGRGMNYSLAEYEIETPKHEPPPKPLPADNLKPYIKSVERKAVGKAKKVRKNKKKDGKINPQTPPSNALTDVSNYAGSSSNSENNLKSGKKGHNGWNIIAVEGGGARANKAGKHKDKKLFEVIETPIVAAGEGSSHGAKEGKRNGED